MATPTRTRVQTWLEPKFARELKQLADADGRSLSGLIRVVLQEQLATSPYGEGPAPGGKLSPRRGAGTE
jgi:hypothetical protein